MGAINIESTMLYHGGMQNRQLEIWVYLLPENIISKDLGIIRYVSELLEVDHTETELRSKPGATQIIGIRKKKNPVVSQKLRKGKSFKNQGVNIVKFHKDVKSDQKWKNVSWV